VPDDPPAATGRGKPGGRGPGPAVSSGPAGLKGLGPPPNPYGPRK
jgi:hypothetical protein